jgi:hypothetical protein
VTAGPLHTTLEADTVATLTVDVTPPRADNLSFVALKSQVRVTNVSGDAAVYFTVDGSTPTVGGTGCYVLPASMCSLRLPVALGPTAAVKAISSGAPSISVWDAT